MYFEILVVGNVTISSLRMDFLNGNLPWDSTHTRTGTDYLYSRFRPGLGSTLVGLLIFISGMQYVFHSLTANRHRAHIQRYIDEAKEMAWRPHGGNPPLTGARKYVTFSDQNEEDTGPVRKFVVDFDGSVYFIDDETGEESRLDVNEVPGASWKRTLIYSLPVWLWNMTAGRYVHKGGGPKVVEKIDKMNSEPEGNGKSPTSSKYTKVEKVAGRRKPKKR